MTIEIGRLVTKIAGRDAGCKALIIDILDDKYVLIDGETRRRKCNILHIEPLNQVVEIEKNASHEDVAKALKEVGIETRQTKPKPKTEKPKRKRKTPEQLRMQKEEKRKLRDLFKFKKKEEKAEERKEEGLEEKAGLKIEEIKEPEKVEGGLEITPIGSEEVKTHEAKVEEKEQKEVKSAEEKETKKKEIKTKAKKTGKTDK